ncbi:MAG TPA: S9 family peptidase [Gemmatimonadales bacterium]|nr:S9 family peptidase [Gemmatimonadales bacterium]
MRTLLLAFLAAGVLRPVAAQSGPSPDSALAAMTRRIFGSPEFAVKGFGPARWLDGGAAYTTLEPAPGRSSARELVRYATATGERTVLVSAAQLTPPGAREPLAIEDYQWSPDGARLLIFTNSERVWRDNTRGDYWVLTRASGSLRKLGSDAAESSLMFTKFSPEGDRVGYVRGGDLYVERVADGAITRLTTDGSRTRVNGTTDWVYEEEFSLRDAFRWSPDGRRIAFWQFDMTGVRDFLLINSTDSLYSFTIPVQYPKAGGTNSAVRAGVIDATGGPITWLDLPGDPRDDYLPRMEWAAGSTELVLQRMNRRQNVNQVFLADAATGKLRPVLTETDSLWLDVVNDWRWLRGGREFLWVSERSGWRHVEVVARDGSSRGDITPGRAEVMSVAAVDPAGGWLYYIASPDNPTQSYLYRARLDGQGRAERLTPATSPGTHGYLISPDARWAIHRYSRFDQPPAIDLVRLPSHESVRVLQDNAGLRAQVAALGSRAPEFFRVPVDSGVELDGWMLFPRDFDPAKRYPLLMHVYSEPAGQTVLDGWGGGSRLWHRALADRGYVVASVDNRGTPAPRGRSFRKAGTDAIGTLSSRDQAEAVRALTRTRPYLDATRVAIWGWSGGGSATLNAMFRYPDVYQVGMSVAPVPDQRLYDTIYQERYMGRPQDNEAGYAAGSPISHAEGLAGDLLVVHGSGDDNVHYQGTERLVNRLVELGKRFDLMVYPNRSHCICEGQGTTLHVYQLLGRYLVEHLPPGGR